MSNATYASAPVQTSEMPRGIPYIVGNEAAERFNYFYRDCKVVSGNQV